MAELSNNITECSLISNSSGYCSSPNTISLIAKILKIDESKDIISEAKVAVGCGGEKCVLQKLKSDIGIDEVARELLVNFKLSGHTDTTLLTNVNIDSILKQWTLKFNNFYAYNFNMRDYASHSFDTKGYKVLNKPDTLATIRWEYIKQLGKNCAACVINSDYYHGPGVHWMALFLDARDPLHQTIEFFNSTGGAPAPEWINWMVKMRQQLEEDPEMPEENKVELIKVSTLKHQNSKTECGVYSLYYIWSRLNGVSYDVFRTKKIDDEEMYKFRYHLFHDDTRPEITIFDIVDYKKNTHIK